MPKAATPINERALLTRQMAADYMSISYDLFIRYERSGDIKGMAISSGREKRYRRRDVDALIDAVAEGTTNIDKAKKAAK